MRYHHIGIPTEVVRDGERHLPALGMYVSGWEESPFGVEWMRFEPDSPLPELVRTVAHVAFEVDDLDAALEGREVIIEPTSPSEGILVAFVVHDGAPVEFIEDQEDGRVRGSLEANPVLETALLMLRPLEMSDARKVRELAGSREVARNTASIPYPYPEGAAEEWIAEQAGDDTRIVFAIVESGSEELVGGIGLRLEPEHERGELGYWIGEEWWGRGYATEAAEAVVRFAFEELGLERVHARTFARNPASRRVLEKIGMRREGLLPRHFKKWNEFVDVEIYGIVLEDWLEDEVRRRTDDADERKDD